MALSDYANILGASAAQYQRQLTMNQIGTWATTSATTYSDYATMPYTSVEVVEKKKESPRNFLSDLRREIKEWHGNILEFA